MKLTTRKTLAAAAFAAFAGATLATVPAQAGSPAPADGATQVAAASTSQDARSWR